MKISVIVATYNGAKKIERLLVALTRQTKLSDEIIVVIDGSIDNTDKVLVRNEFKSLNIKILTRSNSGRAVSRNKGVEIAIGDILIFYDDDMEPLTDSIEKHVETIINSGSRCLSGGNSIEPYSPRKTDIQNYKSHLTVKWTKKYATVVTRLTRENLFFTAGNCAMSKEIFEALHGFDPMLTDAEDFDMALRAITAGLPVFFDKSNQAIHHDPISCRSYIKRIREYKLARKHLKEKYPDEKLVRSQRSNFLKKVCYRFFAVPFFVKLIDQNKFVFLPKPLRYKLYDVVIQSLSSEFPEVAL